MEKQSVMLETFLKIKQDILLGKYKPGDRLNIEQLKRDYHVSLTPIREALNRLVSIDFVEFIPNKGFRVMPITLDEVVDLYETWLFVLKQAMTLAIQHGDDHWESEILASKHRLEKLETSIEFATKPDLFAYVSRYRDFHQALISACPSQWLLKLDDTLFEQAERYRFVKFLLADDIGAMLNEKAKAHNKMIKHLLKRETTAALAVLDKLFLGTIVEIKRIWPKLETL